MDQQPPDEFVQNLAEQLIDRVVASVHRRVDQDWPYQSVPRYAELNGLTQAAVRSLVHRGTIPVKPKARKNDKTFINVALIEKRALEQRY